MSSVVHPVVVIGLLAHVLHAGPYDIPKPFASKGLSPVAMTEHREYGPLVLASAGRAAVPIVCQPELYYRQIANQLKQYLDAATGADFVIVTQAPPTGRAIFVGPAGQSSVRTVFEQAQRLPPESLIVATVAEGLVLAGHDADCANRLVPRAALDVRDQAQSRGTFFAAVDFLERLVGCRFYFPGIGVHTPDYAGADLAIPPVSYSDTPVFNYRAFGYNSGMDDALTRASPGEGQFWNTLLRLGDIELVTSWHTDARWPEVFTKTHPEYFALRANGTRAVGEAGEFSSYRCYTSEAGFKAHIDAIAEYYETGTGKRALFCPSDLREFMPNRKYIHWGISDGFRGCHCAECLKLWDPDQPGAAQFSKLYYTYVLKLAREIKKRWPDKILEIMAYAGYRTIPDWVDRENPGNILFSAVRVGPDSTSAAFLKETSVYEQATADARRRRRLSPERPYIWLHYPHSPRSHNAVKMPYLAPHAYQKFFAENKNEISGCFFNGYHTYSYALDSLMLYIMYKVSWNPDFDVDACITEYCTTLFGPAGKTIGEFYGTLVDRWENVRFGHSDRCYDVAVPREFYFKQTYPLDIRQRLEALLRQAITATAPGSMHRQRVDFLVEGFKPFFEFGRYMDLGKVFKLTCPRWTPRARNGRPAILGGPDGWHAQGVRGEYLYRNENGQFDKTTLTHVSACHDETNLYIGVVVSQPEDFVTLADGPAERDANIWAFSSLEIFLSPEMPGLKEAGLGQTSQYYQIVIDPRDSLWDAYQGNTAVNLDIRRTVHNLKNRAYFELAIPFAELKCVPPQDGSLWYVNFYWNRHVDGKNQGYAWAGTGGYHDTTRFGTLAFTDTPPTPRSAEGGATSKPGTGKSTP